ncbi:SCAN domain-containing protein 3-like, partial [Limulus polyphemus]|uniref:SCAN domain-containing protein 3-like n=1 Tax=Limulus polyphemus TaxID=6850 RepID=A0ABM1B7D2_LIMPO
MNEIIHGQKYADELRKIPLSNDTVGRQILEISNDQFEQLIGRIKESSKFAIQLDEWTDITNMAQHMSGIVTITVSTKIYCSLGHQKDVQRVRQFFKEVGLEWNNCVGVCTDGAAAMTGRIVGFQVKLKSANNEPTTFTHCMTHRETLLAKKISADLNMVLQDAVKVINFIKSCALNSRLLFQHIFTANRSAMAVKETSFETALRVKNEMVCLKNHFREYFRPELDWIQKPFIVEMKQVKHLSLKAQEELAELSCDSNLKLGVKVKFPILSELEM